MTAGTFYTHDAIVVIAVALMTAIIRSQLGPYFNKIVPDWSKLEDGVRSRICVEAAVIPARLMLTYLTFPIIFNGFSHMQTWTAQDTVSSLLICSILTGAYIVDLTVTRNNKGATLHHIMGPLLLIWMRLSYSSFTPADALMCRLLISFVFFGAILSGSTTTALTFIYYFRKVWFKPGRETLSNNAYFYFTTFLPVLALSTICGNFYCALYLHAWFDEVFAHFGHWGYLPLAWVLLECTMQWRWLFWFLHCDVNNRQKFTEDMLGDKPKQTSILNANVWWLPAWRFTVLKVLMYIWYVLLLGIVWRSGDPEYVARLVVSSTRGAFHSHRDHHQPVM